jgi:hypothetical protein
VLPLALYLLTFVAVFRDPPWLRPETVARLPIPVAVLAIGLLSGERQFWLVFVIVNLVAFVLLALLCHGELYLRRPAPALLTAFYLWMSLGGVIGGVFAALLAPQLFTLVYEYPLLVVAALLVLPGMFVADRKRILREIAPVAAVITLASCRGSGSICACRARLPTGSRSCSSGSPPSCCCNAGVCSDSSPWWCSALC